MQALEYKRETYTRKVDAFNTLRAGADALAAGREKYKNLKVWAPNTHQGATDQLEKQHLLGRDIGGVVHYFDNKVSSALDTICEDEFTIHYQIYGDIGRQAMFGSNTVGVYVHVDWRQMGVDVGLYPGQLDRCLARDKLTSAAREGIPDRDQVAKATGWSRNDVRAIDDNQMSDFKSLLEQVRVGQSKLTRLVKGFLMLLECMERGHVDLVVAIQNHIMYGADAVIRSYQQGDRAYVYNSRPSQPVHSAVLWRMCEAYPPPEFAGSHVTVPADGRHVYMVTEGNLVGNGGAVRLTPGLIYASLMTYAMDTSCTSYLQQALVIACSLQQNRYFSKVKLPTVASTFDLMVPAFMQHSTQLDKPILSLPMAKSIGRLHQMLTFTGIRDNLTAAELSTKVGFNPEASMRSFLKSQRLVAERMSSYISELSLIEATSSMHIHDQLDAADFQDLLSISVFEGLWLCQEARRSVHNGVIEALVRGVSDMSNDTTTIDVLNRELQLANVRYNANDIPKGEFTVGWVSVTKLDSFRPVKARTRIRRPMDIARECNYNPQYREIAKRRVRFKRGEDRCGEGDDTPATPIPMEAIRQRAIGRHRKASSSGSLAASGGHSRQTSGGKSERSLPPYPVGTVEGSSETSNEEVYIRSALAAEAAGTDPAAAQAVDAIVAERESQLTEDERIGQKLKEFTNGKCTDRERRSFTAVLKNAELVRLFEASRTRESFLKIAEEKQKFFNYEGDAVIGNSNLAKAINVLIDKGRAIGTGETELTRMQTQGKHWCGDVEQAPTYGLKYVVNSLAWEDYLKRRGIDPNEKTRLSPKNEPTTMRLILAQKLAIMPHGQPKDVEIIRNWLAGVHNDRFPGGLNRQELDTIGSPEELPYRKAPSSLGPRDPDESDSRWLVLASRVERKLFDFTYLKGLCAHFEVPGHMRSKLRDSYGLFKPAIENN